MTVSVATATPADSAGPVGEFLDIIHHRQGSELKTHISAFAERNPHNPVIDGSRFLLLLPPQETASTVPGDVDSWGRYSPAAGHEAGFPTLRTAGTTGWRYLIGTAARDARLQYALGYDGDGIRPDPRNRARVVSFGMEVSEIRMPGFVGAEIELPALNQRGRVERHELMQTRSRISRQIQVYLPPRYDEQPGARYPSAWFHDGTDVLEQMEVDEILDRLIGGGALPAIVAVFMDPAVRSEDYRRSPDWRSFVTEVVIPFVNRNYRIQDTPASRTVIGNSRGALAALDLSLAPDTPFSRAILLMPALSPTSVAAEIADRSELPVTYRLLGGAYDLRFIGDFHAVVDALRVAGSEVHARRVPEGHNMDAWARYLPQMLLKNYGSVHGDPDAHRTDR